MRHFTAITQKTYAIICITILSIIMILTLSPNDFLIFNVLVCLVIYIITIISQQINKNNTTEMRIANDVPPLAVSTKDLSYDSFIDDVIETIVIKTARNLLDTFRYYELISGQETDKDACISIYNSTIDIIRSTTINIIKKTPNTKIDAIDISLYLDISETASIINNLSKTIILIGDYCTGSKVKFNVMIDILRPSLFASKNSSYIYKHVPKEDYFIAKGLQKFSDNTTVRIKQDLAEIMLRHPNKYPKILGDRMTKFISPFKAT